MSIEKSEKLSKILTKENIKHQVLNAKAHEKEADKCQPMILYPAKLSINIDGETKVFHDKTKFSQ